MTSTPPAFGTQLIGQTENALGAILDRQLDGSGLTQRHWVTLTLAVMSGGAVDQAALIGRVSGALNLTTADIEMRIAELSAAGMLEVRDDRSILVTNAGKELHRRVRAAVGEITARLFAGLPAADVDAAGRALATVLERANAELRRS
ncbi:MAG: MarR family winged helix-turn-helix transcriptional regulator [Solirubrobacteraceae bacterium]